MKIYLRIWCMLLLVLARGGERGAAAFDFSFIDELARTVQTDSSTSPTTPTAVIAHFHLAGQLQEKPQDDPFGLNANQQTSLFALTKRLNQALEDKNVKAVVLTYDGMAFGLAQLEELRELLMKFRGAGKPVYAHIDTTYLTLPQYALFSSAAELSMDPMADLWITGLYAESLHLGGLLEKIGVQAEILQREAYKSAGEILLSHESPAAAENMNWLFDGLSERLYAMIVESRGVSRERAQSWVDQGILTADAAKEHGLVDATESQEELVGRLREKFGADTVIVNNYGREEKMKLNFNNPLAIFSIFTQALEQQVSPGGDAVALIYIDGAIMPGYGRVSPFGGGASGAYSGDVRYALKLAAADDAVKAVVLRVDSPGGSALASEVILRAANGMKKPLVVSMGGVAGSGGYYVACGADAIFAEPATITGSIGVIMGKLITKGLWDKLGVNWTPYQRGENADIFSTQHGFDETQRARVNQWMDHVYERFKQRVVEGRGAKLTKPIGEIAGGRVYTGVQAKELGLVDELGGLNAAVAHAAKLAGLTDYDTRILPKPVNPIEALLEELSGVERERPSDLDYGAQAVSPDFGAAAGLLSLIGAQLVSQAAAQAQVSSPEAGLLALLKQLEPQRAALVLQTLQSLQLLQEGPALLMPNAIIVK